jgi:Methyltransferase domain
LIASKTSLWRKLGIVLVWTDALKFAASEEVGRVDAVVSDPIRPVTMDARISKFVVRGRKRVAGWTSRVDAEIFVTALLDQTRRGAKGDTLEIGVHHGRSFLLLNLCAADGESTIAVDIFDRQELNLGHRSGKGDLEKFNANVARFGDVSKTKILQRSSLSLTTEELKTHTAGLRFGHIDGGHWFGVVLNDLRLTASCAGDDCVIALDDFFNPDFPDVAAAYHEWMRERPGLCPHMRFQG